MSRRPVLGLALLSVLTGCVAAPPDGPLVEYHAGTVPASREVKCPATYVLTSSTRPGPPLAEHRVSKGERLGFRSAEDGSVEAVAPGYALALPPGAYAWEVVRDSVPPWRERLWCETRDRGAAPVGTVALVVGVCCCLAVSTGLVLAYFYAKTYDNQPPSRGGPLRPY